MDYIKNFIENPGNIILFWGALLILLVIFEAMTMGLTTIWFAGGALIAMILAIMGFSITVQIIAFFIVSICLLVFTRKIFVEKMATGREKTNVESIIGRKGVALSDIDSLKPGEILVWGQVWTAISAIEDLHIGKETEIMVTDIKGVKAIVIPVDKDVTNDKL